eukprot:scaffold88220_cov44-Prasinocladus_malaysianus.AAC.1
MLSRSDRKRKQCVFAVSQPRPQGSTLEPPCPPQEEPEQVHGENSATMVGKQQMSASARKMSEQQQQVASLTRRIGELEAMKAGLTTTRRKRG